MGRLNNQQHFKFVFRDKADVDCADNPVKKVLPTLVLPIAHFSSTKPKSANNLGILVSKTNN